MDFLKKKCIYVLLFNNSYKEKIYFIFYLSFKFKINIWKKNIILYFSWKNLKKWNNRKLFNPGKKIFIMNIFWNYVLLEIRTKKTILNK